MTEKKLPDEDYTTPEHVLHDMRRVREGLGLGEDPFAAFMGVKLDPDDVRMFRDPAERIGEIASAAVRSLVRDLQNPAARAGACASLLTAALLARSGARAIVAVPIALMMGLTVEKLYEMAEDIHEVSLAQQEYLRKQLDG